LSVARFAASGRFVNYIVKDLDNVSRTVQNAINFNAVFDDEIKYVVIFVWEQTQVNDEVVTSSADFRI